jgi:hypothetical protein
MDPPASNRPPEDEAVRLLESRDYQGAIALLEPLASADATGESHAVLGLARFQLEEYEPAARSFQAALACQPDNADWRDMFAKASANTVAQIHDHVPEITYFDRDHLLARWLKVRRRPHHLARGPLSGRNEYAENAGAFLARSPP